MTRDEVSRIDPTDDELSDTQLLAAVADVVRQPRVEIADSFVLHAPLELAARAALLGMVRPAARGRARARIAAIATGFEAFGDAVTPPRPASYKSTAEGAGALGQAIAERDLDAADAAAKWLGRAASGAELRARLTDALIPRLSAAAHVSIFLYQLPRVAPRGELTAELLRPLARELARFPDRKLRWIDLAPETTAMMPPEALFDAVASTPRPEAPGSDLIQPVMHRTDESGLAAELLAGPVGGVEVADGGRSLLRAAAVWHAPDSAVGDIMTELATRASIQEDAHLVKYTLACFDAAAADPASARLFYSAAASLSAYWRARTTA